MQQPNEDRPLRRRTKVPPAVDAEPSDSIDAAFAEGETIFATKLRRAGLAKQVRIKGMTGTQRTIKKVMLLCLVPEVDRAAVTEVFGDVQLAWYAELDGSIREVERWDAESNSWVEKVAGTPQDRLRQLRGLHAE